MWVDEQRGTDGCTGLESPGSEVGTERSSPKNEASIESQNKLEQVRIGQKPDARSAAGTRQDLSGSAASPPASNHSYSV